MEPIRRIAAMLFVLLLLGGAVRPAQAQPNGDQMCGDGTTFSVHLPATGIGIDDSEGLFRVIDAPPPPPETISLPNGCSIYAFFVSGYANNANFNDWPFYKVAEFVARHNGYVHFSWWNNLLKPYLGGALHPVDVTVRRLAGLLDDVVVPTRPLNSHVMTQALSFAPGLSDLPKANPDEDHQFNADAARVIRAVRAHNPHALIVVAGHSMGGNAVARLGMARDLEIDLLAPIDPVGNRDMPRATVLDGQKFNWTRWRVANNFRGYRRWDCVRNGLGLCHDFDSRLLFTRFECVPVGTFFPTRAAVLPIISWAPIACPRVLPHSDSGVRLSFGGNIRRLYHRWQLEAPYPFDWNANARMGHPQPPSATIFGPNYQAPLLESPLLGPNDPNRTCRSGDDPRDSRYACDLTDGHGEIIGHRGPLGQELPALKLRNLGSWSAAERRQTLIDLATSDDAWPKRPVNPDLCLVCDDMVAIVQDLLDESGPLPTDTIGPVVTAEASPGPNEHGWNNEDVVVTLSAQDNRNGSGVRTVSRTLSGAQTGGGTTSGASISDIVVEEGATAIDYFATDHAGNSGQPQSVSVNIDRTAPDIAAETTPPANQHGWHNAPVVVSFSASDERSGLLGDPVAVSVIDTEGAAQSVSHAAEDRAGNASTSIVEVNLDRTVPSIAIQTPAGGASYLLNARIQAAYVCTDALSGLSTCTGTVDAGAAVDTSAVGGQTFAINSFDLAGNLARTQVIYQVHYGFSGFLPPPMPPQQSGAVRKLPFMWRLFDGLGAPISDAGAVASIAVRPVACGTGTPLGASEPAAGPLRVKAGQYLFALHVDGGWTGCRVLELTLADGTTHLTELSQR